VGSGSGRFGAGQRRVVGKRKDSGQHPEHVGICVPELRLSFDLNSGKVQAGVGALCTGRSG